jgi:hypothetical protein
VFDEDLIPRDHPKWKKATWQKYLIGSILMVSVPTVRRVAYLDTDILINPASPNVFGVVDDSRIGVVSKRHNLPYPRDVVLRRIAFLRNRHFSERYPLDSNLFASTRQLFASIGLTSFEDDFCAGMFVFAQTAHAVMLKKFFYAVDAAVESPTGGGDQLHFNHFVQSATLQHWLPYEFQALWTHEMAWKFPFLYTLDRKDDELVRRCIEASLSTNYFLHFAGSWYESEMWSQVKVLTDPEVLDRWERFAEYLERPVTGKFVGPVKPTQ